MVKVGMDEYLSKEFIEKLLDAHLADSNGAEHYAYNIIKRELMAAPGADVAEVIHCKDCKWFEPDENIMPKSGRCEFHEMVKMFWDFCSRGKEDEDE